MWHGDANGVGTVIQVWTGWKWWILAREKHTSDFASISLYLDSFNVDETNDNKWDLEAILLGPGSTL
jgi:hypothetical protein